MRIAYLDCYAGIAGDMFLGALLDAGVSAEVLHQAATSLNLNASLRIEKVDRSGITSTKVHVLEGDHIAEAAHPHTHAHQSETQPTHQAGHAHTHSHSHAHEPHEHSHSHAGKGHEHPHVHGRSLTEIRALIVSALLPSPVKDFAVRAFELLGHAEARIHNVPVDDIHFHEVGAVDAIVDIVAAAAGIHSLGIDAWHCSPINVGGGTIDCAHGTFPVPAPATADLLRGMPTYSAHIEKELVTPTGAALIRALSPLFGPQPAMRIDQIGYGAGSRNPAGFANALRLSIGESGTVPAATDQPGTNTDPAESVIVLETALDDLSPQLVAHAAEAALASGALDVMLTPVTMKKGRPGTLFTVLCNPADSPRLQQLLLRETSTLGIRIRHDRRICLSRTHTTVSTSYGNIRIKLGLLNGETLNIAPEFEDCRAAAARCSVAVKLVQQAAISAYNQAHKR
ncbi:MAG TPA: nickel pincer cofactor biosynthesis protein LarC [Acidobacteriaceae bacterium]|nr:nickel pincer cofactor biosynthesis protein LarC [Acidobacteriaceae bacterium]